MSGAVSTDEARAMLAAWRVRWVFYSPSTSPRAAVETLPECVPRYQARGINVADCAAGQVRPNAGGMPSGSPPGLPGPNR